MKTSTQNNSIVLNSTVLKCGSLMQIFERLDWKLLQVTTFLLLSLAITTAGHTQAILPASWSFSTTTLPAGWTEQGTGFYTASGNTPPAMKFDSSNDFLQIHLAGNPGKITYYMAGNSFSGGTFNIEESVNGTTWTVIRSHTSPPNATYEKFEDTPSAASRYIRFFYKKKEGGNIGIDDVEIQEGSAGPEQEIELSVNTDKLVSGATRVVQSPLNVPRTLPVLISNKGTASALNITNITLTGAAAADFVVEGATNFSIPASGSQTVNLKFTPTVAGTRMAQLNISSNDSDESNFEIKLYGIGGDFASEPVSQASNLTFKDVKTYRITGQFTAAATSNEGYLILRKTGSAVTEIPEDGKTYLRGDYIGGAQVVAVSTSLNFIPNNIIANGNYHFAIFALNGPKGYENYLTSNPLKNNVQTPATLLPTNYYNGISTSNATFVADLHTLINPHKEQYYSNYAALMITKFAVRDTTNNQRVITCSYSGENKVYSEPFDFTSNGYSREHTYCHSWMPTHPAEALPEYNDYHHLFPVNQDKANAVRSNFPLGEVVTPSGTFLGAKFGVNSKGKGVYEPRNSHKGIAARALMYEAICYNSVNGKDWSFPEMISGSIPYGQDPIVIKKWHLENPPSNWEIARNDFIDSLQENRNPFVDNPLYACYINFSTMKYEALGCIADVEEALLNALIIFPNPATAELNIHVDASQIVSVQLIDVLGRIVLEHTSQPSVVATLDISQLKQGNYIVEVTTIHGSVKSKFIKE